MFCPWIVILVLFDTVVGIEWIEPKQGNSFSVDVNDANSCNSVTTLDASAPTSYSFSISNNFANGEFAVEQDENYNEVLKCDVNKLSKASYTVTLRAFLDSDNNEYSEINITVIVDNLVTNRAPVFHNLPTTVSLLRNKYSLDGEYVLMDVNVTDEDGDLINMTLSETTKFAVSGTQIKVVATLEDLTSPFELVVTAADNGTPVESSTSTLTLSLGYGPEFDNLATATTVDVNENVAVGTTVFELTVSDQDNTTMPTVSIMSESVPSVFKLDGKTLKTNALLDKETLDSYNITFNATDGTYVTESAVLTINVKDVNDVPVITSVLPSNNVSISELTVAGTNVFNVSASDQDTTSPNNMLTFSLTGSTDFSINSTSGEVSIATGVTLNYTVKATYDLLVNVTDGGTPLNSATTTVYVVTETEPVFDNLASPVSVDLDENADLNTAVFTLTVSDGDGKGPLLTTLLTPNDDFILNGNILNPNQTIDAEKQQTHVLRFKVSDGTYETQSADLTITVNDLNDMPPVIVKPTHDITIPETAAVGYSIVTVTAADADLTSPNNLLTYSIQYGNDKHYFAINSKNGSVTLAKVPIDICQDTYPLNVIVVDGGTPALNDTVQFHIVINATTVDECTSNPCKNAATCSSYINVYYCSCATGWTGIQCETPETTSATEALTNVQSNVNTALIGVGIGVVVILGVIIAFLLLKIRRLKKLLHKQASPKSSVELLSTTVLVESTELKPDCYNTETLSTDMGSTDYGGRA